MIRGSLSNHKSRKTKSNNGGQRLKSLGIEPYMLTFNAVDADRGDAPGDMIGFDGQLDVPDQEYLFRLLYLDPSISINDIGDNNGRLSGFSRRVLFHNNLNDCRSLSI